MNRRDFLKVCAAAGLATAVPLKALAPIKEIKLIQGELGVLDGVIIHPGLMEYGRSLPFNIRDVAPHWSKLMDILAASAKKTLPPGSRYEIRRSAPSKFDGPLVGGRHNAVAWYSVPELYAREPYWPTGFVGVDKGVLMPRDAYYLHGRGVA